MPCSDCSPAFSALKKLQECKLLSRVRRNEAPVASERVEFTRLISQGERDLVGYEETIARLQEAIVALKNEQKSLYCQLHLAKSLMVPIRKLPPEVLCQIFTAHGSANIIRPDESATCSVPGFKVTSICSHWRSVAMDTTALWNDITAEIGEDTHYDSRLPVTERLLSLSQKSLLSISINAKFPKETVTSTIPLFVMLCTHANRWQRFELETYDSDVYDALQPILDALASMQGRLDNLHTFRQSDSFKYYSWVKGAPKLHTLSVRFTDDSDGSIAIPWEQIVNLGVKDSSVLRIPEFLDKMPNLLSLDTAYLYHKGDDNDDKDVSHSDLKFLSFSLTEVEDETAMQMFFKLFTLRQLQSLCIEVKEEHLTSQDNLTWMSIELPSLISRSSALITSLSLDSVWMDTSNLVSLLRAMPALSYLFLSESSYEGSDMSPMLNDQLLSSMHIHGDQNRQPILTHLTSLELKISPRASFSIPVFIEMIHSRWKPAYLDNDEVACIKIVRLYVWDVMIAPNTVYSLTVLRKRGLDITIKDKDGEIIQRNEVVE